MQQWKILMEIIKAMIYTSMLTPCFIYDEVDFEQSIVSFNKALTAKFSDVSIGYSVKTNSLPYALRLADKFGCKAEVVSHDEYMLAKQCGYSPADIIYNGPMK